ncbi:MAG TPA: hypothetical protein VFZ75_03060 [Actinomycetota bacterium]|nr:hypothetical protein [Actinomycetota bacterium]
MRKKLSALVVMVAMSSSMLAVTAAPPAAAQNTDPNAIPIVGEFPGGTFEGTFDINRFVARNGVVYAVGTLSGELTNEVTGVVREISQVIRIPVTDILQPDPDVCTVLELTLGPLDLNLLGLRVQLDEVHLLITAIPGGGLLGDLLCSLAGGLGDTTAGAIARLLNQILGLLG